MHPIETFIKQSAASCSCSFEAPDKKEILILIAAKLGGILRRARLPVFGLVVSALLTGCFDMHVSKTVGLPGLPPLADASQVKVIYREKPVPQPYQVVGKVMVKYNNYNRLNWSASNKRMRNVAASMGADAVIGVYEPGGIMKKGEFPIKMIRSGLAVKWLEPGEARKPVTTPFAIKVLPFRCSGQIVYVPDEDCLFSYIWLEDKGYYVLPLTTTNIYTGGLKGASKLSDAGLQAAFGPDAQLLLESTIESITNSSILTANAEVRSTLMDEATRTIVFESSSSCKSTIIPLLDPHMFEPDLNRGRALWGAISKSLDYTSLESVKPIQEEVPQ